MPGENDRPDRLAAALRANLARRKAQARGRTAAQDTTPPAPPATCDGTPAPRIVPEDDAG